MTFTPSEHLQTLLKNLPHKPGCYLMKDAAGAILYVGKAKDLHNRVRSYFDSSLSDPKTLRLRAEIAHIDFIVLPDEIAALHTEYHLIRQHQPRFNVRFKDDKKYPYIAVRWAQDFPRVEITRRLEADGSRYFGPYTSASDVRETLDVLRRAFPYLTCDRTITGKDERACLYHDIKLCNAPVRRQGQPRGIPRHPAGLDGLPQRAERRDRPPIARRDERRRRRPRLRARRRPAR